ncbi:MAG: 50S ribosomal protein L25 [Succinivibrio sp.]|nr:50S ribosomal protein L25 [Succinivibrio sp.]
MSIVLEAEDRKDLGRGASRRLRRDAKIPAIIVGNGQETLSVTLSEQKLILAALKDEFYKENVELTLNGQKIATKVIDIQRHPVSERILHVDFQRV